MMPVRIDQYLIHIILPQDLQPNLRQYRIFKLMGYNFTRFCLRPEWVKVEEITQNVLGTKYSADYADFTDYKQIFYVPEM
jgi:hypothetical protein